MLLGVQAVLIDVLLKLNFQFMQVQFHLRSGVVQNKCQNLNKNRRQTSIWNVRLKLKINIGICTI